MIRAGNTRSKHRSMKHRFMVYIVYASVARIHAVKWTRVSYNGICAQVTLEYAGKPHNRTCHQPTIPTHQNRHHTSNTHQHMCLCVCFTLLMRYRVRIRCRRIYSLDSGVRFVCTLAISASSSRQGSRQQQPQQQPRRAWAAISRTSVVDKKKTRRKRATPKSSMSRRRLASFAHLDYICSTYTIADTREQSTRDLRMCCVAHVVEILTRTARVRERGTEPPDRGLFIPLRR